MENNIKLYKTSGSSRSDLFLDKLLLKNIASSWLSYRSHQLCIIFPVAQPKIIGACKILAPKVESEPKKFMGKHPKSDLKSVIFMNKYKNMKTSLKTNRYRFH